MRPGVTRTALRDVAMLVVAAYTIDLTMFTRCFGPLGIGLVMADAASPGIGVFCKLDLQWLMHGMTFAGTGLELLAFIMRLVTGVAAGNKSVRRMAIVTRQLGMLAGEFLQLFERTAVTAGT